MDGLGLHRDLLHLLLTLPQRLNCVVITKLKLHLPAGSELAEGRFILEVLFKFLYHESSSVCVGS